jgi:ATP/maltotriose-dependent transcriptional regulator MalT
MAQAAVDVGGDDTPAVAQWLLAIGHASSGDYDLAINHSRSAIAKASESGDDTTRAVATASLVHALAAAGDEPAARELIPEALALAENLGNPTITVSAHLVIAGALTAFGSTAEAIELLERPLRHADAGGPLVASDIRAVYAYLIDDADRAAEILRPALAAAKEQLSGRHQLPPLVSAAKWLFRKHDWQTAARLFGALGHLDAGADMSSFFSLVTGPYGYFPGPGPFGYEAQWAPEANDLVDKLRAAMGEREFEEQLRRGAELSGTEALQLAEDALYR